MATVVKKATTKKEYSTLPKLLKFKKVHIECQKVIYAGNDKELGEIYKEVDGSYVYLPCKEAQGCWSGEVLAELGMYLIHMNGEQK